MAASKTLLASALTVFLAVPALADRPAKPGPLDDRIRSVAYSARDVVRINGHYGFTTSIELHQNETIQTISIGDSEAWQIVKPGTQPNVIFVKPIEQNADTNMTVITDRRVYNFMLFARQAQNHDSPGLTFHVKFKYPDDDLAVIAYQADERQRLAGTAVSPSALGPDQWNFSYGYSGSDRLRPVRVFDDGRFTYFAFSDIEATPAIFIVDENRNEQLVNSTKRGKYIVVERLSRQFTLRDGDTYTCIFNQDFPKQDYDGSAPMRVTDTGEPIDQTDEPATTNPIDLTGETDE